MKVFWRLLRFIQGHKWRSFTMQYSSGTKSGMKIRVYRKWYIRVSVNPGVNPCKPPLVFGQASFKSIMHTCNHLFTTYPDIFQRGVQVFSRKNSIYCVLRPFMNPGKPWCCNFCRCSRWPANTIHIRQLVGLWYTQSLQSLLVSISFKYLFYFLLSTLRIRNTASLCSWETCHMRHGRR